MIRVESHALGPRCFVAGLRVHEWHLGLATLVAAVAAVAMDAPALLASALALTGAWLVAKDWHDLVPSRRDTAAWRLGIHRAPAALRRAYRGESLPAAAGWLTGAVGAFNVISALTPGAHDRLAVLTRITGVHAPLLAHALALPAGLALLVLAPYLARRRRRALQLAIVLLVGVGALNLLKGLDVEEAVASWALAGVLTWGRDAFCVAHERLAPRAALRSLLAPATTALAAGLAALVADLWTAPTVTVGVGFLVALAVARLAFRPLAAPSRPPPEAQRCAARRLVQANGSDTLSFFKLRGDLQHFISGDGRAFLSYRVENGVLLCSGDPVGPPEAIPSLLSEVCSFAEERGLRLGVVGGGELLRELAADAGLRALYIGDEAIVDTGAFSLEGRAIRKVRQSVTRLVKAGYTTELSTLSEVGPAELAVLEEISERWLGGEPERGFSMAMDGLRGRYLGDSTVLIARDEDGRIRGFLHFVPSYGSPRASLSAMRRDCAAPNGVTEFMLVRAIELFGARGVEELSLNFAAFARLVHAPATRAERLLGRLVALADPFFQIESLYSFNAKLGPRWQPRYLLYEGRLGLPRAALAALWAEGQLPKPRLPGALRRDLKFKPVADLAPRAA